MKGLEVCLWASINAKVFDENNGRFLQGSMMHMLLVSL